jgi:thiol-disulfide isomerase/thioredoxin
MHRLVVFAFLALAAVGAAPTGTAAASAEHDVLHAYAFTPAEGQSLALSSMKGEVVVLAFWATWCRPCRTELPRLAELHENLKARGGRVLAVSVDTDPDRVADFLERYEIALPVVIDGPDGLARSLDLESLPYALILDRNGEVAARITGSGEDAWSNLVAAAERAALAEPRELLSEGRP